MGNCCYTKPEVYTIVPTDPVSEDSDEGDYEQPPQDLAFKHDEHQRSRFTPHVMGPSGLSNKQISAQSIEVYHQLNDPQTSRVYGSIPRSI